HMKKREFAWQIITYNLEKLSQSIKALLKLLTKATIMNNAVFLRTRINKESRITKERRIKKKRRLKRKKRGLHIFRGIVWGDATKIVKAKK
ncbi:MAG: hypothetical protein KKH40_08305, partial [Nanoarchaeota archaeon]|nr:hypothetical protein [Nanoarchaeota archaeon]